jgi:cytochrome c biogenesis protein CcdA
MALAALDTFSVGFLLALVLFGVHLVALGALLYRSHYLPRVLGVLLVAAGMGYIADGLAAAARRHGTATGDPAGRLRAAATTREPAQHRSSAIGHKEAMEPHPPRGLRPVHG